MKIDESCIDYNAVRLIKEENASLNEYDKEDMIAVMGFINGVLAMAEELKEVLKA